MAQQMEGAVAAGIELVEFVRDALARGSTRAEIEQVLLRAGWSRELVDTAVRAYADVEFPIPVPKPKSYLSAREAFFYLLLFTTLYISAYNIGVAIFQYINRAFPDPAADISSYASYMRQELRWALSSLIVSFPVFLYLSAIVERSVRQDPGKRHSNVRRWLMYLTVFAAASVLIGDFITLVYNALGGELTTRFVLKVLTIAVIAGTVFSYYLSDLRLEESKTPADGKGGKRVIAGFAAVAFVAVVATGLVMIGSPANERARRLDARRVNDLRGISDAAETYLQRHGHLPASVDDLSNEGGMIVHGRDPEGSAYEYRVHGPRAYELCATFLRDSSDRPTSGSFWSHGPGRRCFQLQVKEPTRSQ